jgi:hypothetical protein
MCFLVMRLWRNGGMMVVEENIRKFERNPAPLTILVTQISHTRTFQRT